MVQNRLFPMIITMFLLVTSAAQSAEWNPRTPLQYPSSLHSKIAFGDTKNMSLVYGDKCLLAAKAFLIAGGNFYSKTVVKYSAPFEKSPRADVIDNTFFHWTPAQAAFDKIANQKSYGDLFSYIRNKSFDLYDAYIYLAADPESSQQYGDRLYKFTLKKNSRVFFLKGDYESGYYIPDVRLNSMIVKEVSEKNPALATCDVRGETPDAPTLLTALALEASDIALIAYIGVDNKFGMARGSQWFQLVGEWSIESMQPFGSRSW